MLLVGTETLQVSPAPVTQLGKSISCKTSHMLIITDLKRTYNFALKSWLQTFCRHLNALRERKNFGTSYAI